MSGSAFSKFMPYARRLQGLALGGSRNMSRQQWLSTCNPALDGEPAKTLRQQVPIHARRRAGAFFTGSTLARRLLGKVKLTAERLPVMLDPACGAGDLLLAAARRLPLAKSFKATIELWGNTLRGIDLQPEFIAAARARLLVLARQRHRLAGETDLHWPRAFSFIRTGDALRHRKLYAQADLLLFNPPFSPMIAPADCTWASGSVNSAAVFLEQALNHVRPGTRILAILPEVLRTGTRYAKWRRLVSQDAERLCVESSGIFDTTADVDVFLLVLKKRPAKSTRASANWLNRQPQPGPTVSDHFRISVGPVVPYRTPRKGPRQRYIHPRNVAPWKTVHRITETRRFSGRVSTPPFVVIRRTSRPGDKFRAVGSIVCGKSPVAVENHLIVCTPNDGTVASCQALLKALQHPQANSLLNRLIRCRHLTVASVKSLLLRAR